MRVLWFSVTPSMYSPRTNCHNGGGWISSLERIVRTVAGIKLGVAFYYPEGDFRQEVDGVLYYPILKSHSLDALLEIVHDFHPDLIQIFGSENDFGQICGHVDVPVVIHLQGCIPPYENALFPIDMNHWDFLFSRGLTFRRRLIGLRSKRAFRSTAKKEVETIKQCNYFMGRTDWDKSLVGLFHPGARYFHCEEALRDSFIHSERKWSYNELNKKTIVSVISNPWYKGMDLILKTANLLRQFTNIDFEWKIFGVSDIHFYEYKYGIKAEDVGVNVMGTASQEQLVDVLCQCSCLVHPSYIDNSPNSICEAQYLGVPVIATNVGGIPSLVKDGETGLLVPANAPYDLSAKIKMLLANPQLQLTLSENACRKAHDRHNPETIKATLIKIYHYILNDK